MTDSQPGWHIVHLDLGIEVPDLIAVPNTRGTYVVFWRAGVPLGDVYLEAGAFPMTASELAAAASRAVAPAVAAHLGSPATGETSFLTLAQAVHPLRRLEAALEASDAQGHAPTASVVVCTRDRPAALRRCLDALLTLDPAPSEIIVVDNAPTTEATREVVATSPGVRYVCERRPGLDIARNTGAQAARGDIVAYTDDDVEVHPTWIGGVRRAFHSPEVMAATGLVLPAELETAAQLLFEQHWGFSRGYQPRNFDASYLARHARYGAPVWEIGAGANMAFRRAVFEEVGGFDERLDVGAAGCNGDSEMWYRILAAGYACRYEPTAVVHHYHRESLEGLRRQLYYYMRGHVAALFVQYERTGDRGNIRRLTRALPRYYLRRLAQAFRGRFRGNHRMIFPEIAGCLSGVGFYLRNRRPSEERQSDEHPEPAAL